MVSLHTACSLPNTHRSILIATPTNTTITTSTTTTSTTSNNNSYHHHHYYYYVIFIIIKVSIYYYIPIKLFSSLPYVAWDRYTVTAETRGSITQLSTL